MIGFRAEAGTQSYFYRGVTDMAEELNLSMSQNFIHDFIEDRKSVV